MDREKSDKILKKYKKVFDSLEEYDKNGKLSDDIEKRIKRKLRKKKFE